MVTTRQHRMFQTEDLPLFSSTPLRGNVEPLETEPEQEPLPAECEFCQATGLVGLCLFEDPAFCWVRVESDG